MAETIKALNIGGSEYNFNATQFSGFGTETFCLNYPHYNVGNDGTAMWCKLITITCIATGWGDLMYEFDITGRGDLQRGNIKMWAITHNSGKTIAYNSITYDGPFAGLFKAYKYTESGVDRIELWMKLNAWTSFNFYVRTYERETSYLNVTWNREKYDSLPTNYTSEIKMQAQAMAGNSLIGHNHNDSYSVLGHTHTVANITDFPTSLPANGGSATYAARLGTSTGYYTKATLDTALAGKADVSHGTHISSGAQTWSGVKTFSSAPVFSAGFTSSSNVTVTGKVSASSGFYEESDSRLKDFEDDINIDLDKIKQLPKKYFRWKEDPTNLQIGTSAQAVQELYPELVDENENGNLTVAYDKLSVIALAAVDQLSTELNTLKDELQQIKAHLNLI